jgi:hypothetical protein
MGMFDYIKCEIKLPDNTLPDGREFQTKSLDSAMENYVITVKGELYREVWDYEWIEDSEHFLGGYQHRIEDSYRREYLTNFHGDVIFYDGKKINELWRNYTARFTEGRLARMWYKDETY